MIVPSVSYEVNTRVRLSAAFTDIEGGYFDPTSIILTVAQSGQETQSYDYPGYVVRDGPGAYHYDCLFTATGMVTVLWQSTAAGQEVQATTYLQIVL